MTAENHTVVAHAKGVDTTAVCRAAYKVERVTTVVHVFFRSFRGFIIFRRCCVLIFFSSFWINVSVDNKMKTPILTCFQSFTTSRNRLKTRTAPPFHRGIFSPAKLDLPRGETHDTRGDLFPSNPEGKSRANASRPKRWGGGGGSIRGGEAPVTTVFFWFWHM